MKILVCNAGSTSLKFKLFEMPSEKVLAKGNIERVGDNNGGIIKYFHNEFSIEEKTVVRNYEDGINRFLSYLLDKKNGALSDISEIDAVGFKTVLSKNHYGVHILDEETIQGMRDFLTVAPAHNKHYLEAVSTFKKILPDITMVGAFETAFHQTMPEEAYIYSAPYEWYEKYGTRRFGYHGASHSYVADCLTAELGEKYKAVSCHLGGSSSLCAIVNGKSTDTSFGMSLQCGLPQSNRAGDIDPFIINYMIENSGKSKDEVFTELSTNGGLLGISGISNDLRDIESKADTNKRAALAVSIYTRELIRYIGGYAAIMQGLDAIAFTAGIGENSVKIRDAVIDAFAFLGAEKAEKEIPAEHLPPETGIKIISGTKSKIKVFVIPANEELGVARKTYSKLNEK